MVEELAKYYQLFMCKKGFLGGCWRRITYFIYLHECCSKYLTYACNFIYLFIYLLLFRATLLTIAVNNIIGALHINPQNNYIRYVLLLSPFYRRVNSPNSEGGSSLSSSTAFSATFLYCHLSGWLYSYQLICFLFSDRLEAV